MSHIPEFGDAPTSPCEDTATLAGNAAPTSGKVRSLATEDVSSPARNAASPAGDMCASPKSGICDTYCHLMRIFWVNAYFWKLKCHFLYWIQKLIQQLHKVNFLVDSI